jgi:hypothetical protein
MALVKASTLVEEGIIPGFDWLEVGGFLWKEPGKGDLDILQNIGIYLDENRWNTEARREPFKNFVGNREAELFLAGVFLELYDTQSAYALRRSENGRNPPFDNPYVSYFTTTSDLKTFPAKNDDGYYFLAPTPNLFGKLAAWSEPSMIGRTEKKLNGAEIALPRRNVFVYSKYRSEAFVL